MSSYSFYTSFFTVNSADLEYNLDHTVLRSHVVSICLNLSNKSESGTPLTYEISKLFCSMYLTVCHI